MGREIKFRGKCKSDKKWVYGYFKNYLNDDNKLVSKIISIFGNSIDIIVETLGQYTGLKDKNGKEIYEGDIVEVGDFIYSIKYDTGSFMLVRISEETDMYLEFDNCWNDDVYPLCQLHWESDAEENTLYNCEVKDNIYENPALINR